MRLYLKYLVGVFAFIALALPACARTEHMDLYIQQQGKMIGSTQVAPGAYQIKIDDGKTDLMVKAKDGRVVIDAHGQWVKLPARAQDSEVMYVGNHLVEVQFDGQTEAFKIS